jgi:hypothetical protein
LLGFLRPGISFITGVQSVAPGVKTFLISAVGIFGSAGAAAQEYLTGVPLEKFVTAQEALLIVLLSSSHSPSGRVRLLIAQLRNAKYSRVHHRVSSYANPDGQ